MLSKNEIKLLEKRNGTTIRRLVFTEAGYVRLVDDFHYEGITVDNEAQELAVREISPTIRLLEEDFVLEHSIETERESRFELYRFTDGRLRSLSLSANMQLLQGAIAKNREINRWIGIKTPMGKLLTGLTDRIFQNETWTHPTGLRQATATLKNLIPSKELWEGLTPIQPLALVASFHKLYRLFAKQQPALSKRGKCSDIQFDPALLQEKNVWYFDLGTRGKAKLITPDSQINYETNIVKIKLVGKMKLAADSVDIGYSYGSGIYKVELVQFTKSPETNIPAVATE